MPLLGAANLSLNKAHDRGRQCNSKARADICKQLLARASLDYSPNPPGGWDLARSRVFSQGAKRARACVWSRVGRSGSRIARVRELISYLSATQCPAGITGHSVGIIGI